MPTYEYKCKECECSFEALQSMRDEPLAVCPECGGPVRRVLSGGAGVIFKGQGFYVTDKGKSGTGGGVHGGAKKGSTTTANSNPEQAAAPCSTCPAAAAGASCATKSDNAS
jgi:putative FmdB family regulatory protein